MRLQQRYRAEFLPPPPPPPAGQTRIDVCRRILAMGLGKRLIVADGDLRWDVGSDALLGTRQLLRPITWDQLSRISDGEPWTTVIQTIGMGR
jgi:hypothetical protein